MAFVFRFFFDPGSGTCLWSASAEANALYDYPVNHHKLPIPESLKKTLDQLVEKFDTDFDWNDPPGEGQWSDDERREFWRDVNEAVLSLCRELPFPAYEIRDETRRQT